MFIELHTRAKGSKCKYVKYLVNINNIVAVEDTRNIIIVDINVQIKESYDDIKKMLDKHNLLITK